MIAQRISTLAEVAQLAAQEREWSFPLRDFLDGFQAEPAFEKLTEEPQKISHLLDDGGLADAYLASVCDHLCRRHHFPRPSWVDGPGRILKIPHFAAKTHALRMILLQESPAAFRERNIFVSANALSRC
jgi:hypothetical protein